MKDSRRVTRWYALAIAYTRSPEIVRAGVSFSYAKRCTLLAIAGLSPPLAQALEEAGLPWRSWQYIAHGDGAAEQRRRATEELERLAARKGRVTERHQQVIAAGKRIAVISAEHDARRVARRQLSLPSVGPEDVFTALQP